MYVDLVQHKVDPDDLLSSDQVAELLGLRNRRAVSVYRIRYPDFPPPIIDRDRCKFWHRSDVEAWKQHHLGDSTP